MKALTHMRRIQIAFAVSAYLLGSGQAFAQSEAAVPAEPLPEVIVPVRALGREDAPVQIDFYSAFNCVDCARWYLTVLPELRSRYIDTGQARLVFHDVAMEPFQHSVKAAMVGLCADPAHFFEVAQSFMSGQGAVVEDGSKIGEWYTNAIAVAGRPRPELEACAETETIYNMVVAQNGDPVARTFAAFPGVTVNGRVVEDPTLQGVAAAILAASMTAPAPAAD